MFVRLHGLVDGTVRRLVGYVQPNTLKDVYTEIDPPATNRPSRVNARIEISCDDNNEEGVTKARELLGRIVEDFDRRIASRNFTP